MCDASLEVVVLGTLVGRTPTVMSNAMSNHFLSRTSASLSLLPCHLRWGDNPVG
jgi:hypothetical protein